MEFQELLEARRSIRKYNPEKKINEAVIKELIYAAQQAPSWKNSQTARYYCILSEDMLKKFKKECLPEFNANNCDGAAALIVAAFVKNRAGFERATGEPTNELGNGWGCYDLGLANENLILKARELGLGTLIMGIRDAEKIAGLLEIPDDNIIVSVIAVGYPDIAPEKPKRKETDEIVRFY